MPKLNFNSLNWPLFARLGETSSKLNTIEAAPRLAESVAAILLPHLRSALGAYASKDQLPVLAVYSVGCSLLSDLLSQDVSLATWRAAGELATERLILSCSLDQSLIDVKTEVGTLTGWLKRHFECQSTYLEVCHLFESAIGEIEERRMTPRGSIKIKAAMARLEAMALNAGLKSGLALAA